MTGRGTITSKGIDGFGDYTTLITAAWRGGCAVLAEPGSESGWHMANLGRRWPGCDASMPRHFSGACAGTRFASSLLDGYGLRAGIAASVGAATRLPIRETAPHAEVSGAVLLYRVVAENREALLQTAREQNESGLGLPKYVEKEFREYLRCGVLCHGFTRLVCGESWKTRPTPQS